MFRLTKGMFLSWRMRYVALLLHRLVLFARLVPVRVLSLSRPSETSGQREAGQSRDAVFDAAGHDTVCHSLTTAHRPLTTELRSFLICIDVRLYLQVIQQIEIRVQVFVLVEGLEVANGRARLNPR